MFCKTCCTLLRPKKTNYGEWLACPHGHTQPELNQDKVVTKSENLVPVKRIEIMDDKNLVAVYDHKCPKCGHDKAELIEISCFYSDEDNIYRMKCGKCGHVVQLDGKVK